jgi:hypothetical protein
MPTNAPAKSWTLPGDVLNRIALDVGSDVSVEDSVLLYNDEMLEFREVMEAEWKAHLADNPDAVLHVPEELPSANIPSASDEEE